MVANYVINFGDLDTEKPRILETGSLRLWVTWDDGGPQTKVFHHCLHCNISFSRSGLFYHQERKNISSVQKFNLGMRFLSNPNRQKEIIRKEFETCFVNGKLRRRFSVSKSPVHPFAFTPIQRQDQPPVIVSEPSEPPVQLHTNRDVSHPPRVETVREVNEDPESDEFPPDLNACFSSEGFDPQRFDEFARDFSVENLKRDKIWKINEKKRRKSSQILHRTSTSCAHCRKTRSKTSLGFGRQ